jgi:hypothetical protein
LFIFFYNFSALNFPMKDQGIICVYSNEQTIVKDELYIVGLITKARTYNPSEDLTVEDLIVLSRELRRDG